MPDDGPRYYRISDKERALVKRWELIDRLRQAARTAASDYKAALFNEAADALSGDDGVKRNERD